MPKQDINAAVNRTPTNYLGLQTWTPAKGLVNLTQRPVVGCITRRSERLRCQEHRLEIMVDGNIFAATIHSENEILSADETTELLTVLTKAIKRKSAGERLNAARKPGEDFPEYPI